MAGNSYALQLSQTLAWKLRNFPSSVYSFDPGSNLDKLATTLLGSSGTGLLAIIQTAARLSQQYLQFSDLEGILGVLVASPRLQSELYNSDLNPFTDQLSRTQWKDVLAKDSLYRERLMGVSAAKLRGATSLGLQMIAESSCDAKFTVYENWTSASGVLTASGYSRGLGRMEVVLVPNMPSGLDFTPEMYHTVVAQVNSLRPVGTSVTVSTGTINTFNPVSYSSVSGSSTFLTLGRSVLASNISIPASVNTTNDPSLNSRYWLVNNQAVPAPFFAFTETQEQEIDFTANIVNVEVVPIYGGITTTDSMLGQPTMSLTSTIFGEK